MVPAEVRPSPVPSVGGRSLALDPRPSHPKRSEKVKGILQPDALLQRIRMLEKQNLEMKAIQDELLVSARSSARTGSVAERPGTGYTAALVGTGPQTPSSTVRSRRASSSGPAGQRQAALDVSPGSYGSRGLGPTELRWLSGSGSEAQGSSSLCRSASRGAESRRMLPLPRSVEARRGSECGRSSSRGPEGKAKRQFPRPAEAGMADKVPKQKALREARQTWQEEMRRLVGELHGEQQQMRQEHQRHLQALGEESARLQQSYEARLLQMEETLMLQEKWREQELLGELYEVDREWQALDLADSNLRTEATQLRQAREALSSQSLVQGVPLPWQAPSPQQCGRAAPLDPAVPELDAGRTPCYTGARSLPLSQAVPPVYESALRLVLQSGWEALHGANAGPCWSALHWAAAEGRVDVVELLLRSGANLYHQDELGKTAMDYAREYGQTAVIRILSQCPQSPSMNSAFSSVASPEASQLSACALESRFAASDLDSIPFQPALNVAWPRDASGVERLVQYA